MACEQGELEVVARAGWQANEPRGVEQLPQRPVSLVFIHHTSGRRCGSQDQGAQTARAIQKDHMDARGWDDIGYNFLVDDEGRVYEARGWTRVGAHTRSFNKVAIAISVMGNFSEELPSSAALTAIHRLLEFGVVSGHVTPDFRLYGHRDSPYGGTVCPGAALYEHIRTWSHYCCETLKLPM